MKVKCINHYLSCFNLTIGKVYDVEIYENNSDYYYIITDKGVGEYFHVSRFEIVDETESLDKQLQLDEAIAEKFSKVVKIYNLPYGQDNMEDVIIKKQLLQFIENNKPQQQYKVIKKAK